jgi:hypothetical protein
MTWQTVVLHVTIALAAIAAVSVLAIENILPGTDVQTILVAILVGSGVIAGNVLGGTTTTTTGTTGTKSVTTGAQK